MVRELLLKLLLEKRRRAVFSVPVDIFVRMT